MMAESKHEIIMIIHLHAVVEYKLGWDVIMMVELELCEPHREMLLQDTEFGGPLCKEYLGWLGHYNNNDNYYVIIYYRGIYGDKGVIGFCDG